MIKLKLDFIDPFTIWDVSNLYKSRVIFFIHRKINQPYRELGNFCIYILPRKLMAIFTLLCSFISQWLFFKLLYISFFLAKYLELKYLNQYLML